MNYAELPKSITPSASRELNSNSNDSFRAAESLLLQKIVDSQEKGDLENAEYNNFLLGQLYFENSKFDMAFEQFGRISM